MKDIETLEWILSQGDIDLKLWHFGRTATKDENLKQAPIIAHFYWDRGEEPVHFIEVDYKELSDIVQRFEAKNLKIPKQFCKALENWGSNIHSFKS